MAGKAPRSSEVGRVGVRVMPLTDRFAADLKRFLERIERTTKLEIPLRIDTKQARADIVALRQQIRALGAVKIPVSADTVSTASLAQVARQVAQATQQAAKATVQIQRSSASAAKSVAAASADTDQMQRATLETVSGFRSLANESRKVSANVQKTATSLLTSLRSLRQGKLSGVFSSFGDSNVPASVLAIDKTTRNIRKTTVATLGTLGKIGNVLGKGVLSPLTLTVGQLTKLNRVGAITVAVLALIPVVLGPIAALLAGIPSLLFAFGAAAGAIALGFDGIKASFSRLSPEVDKLQASLSKTFERGLTPEVERLRAIFPVLERGLNQVAEGLTQSFGGIVDALVSEQGLRDINRILSQTGKLFADIRPFMTDFVSGLLTIGRAGADNFDILADSFNKFGAQFRSVMEDLASSGTLRSAFQGLSATLGGLTDALFDIFTASLQMMAEIGQTLGRFLSNIGELFVALSPILTSIAELFLDIGNTLITALLPVFEKLAPVFANFAENIGSLLIPIIEKLAPVLGEIVIFALDLFDAMEPLFPVISQIADVIGTLLLAALEAVRPVLPVISSALAGLAVILTGAISDATPLLEEIATSIGTLLAEAVRTLAPLLPKLAKAFLDIVDALLPVIPPLLQLAEQLLPVVTVLIKGLILPVTQLAGLIAGVLGPALASLVGIVSSVLSALGGLISGLISAGRSALLEAERIVTGIQNVFANMRGRFVDTGFSLMDGLKRGLDGGAAAVQLRAAQIAAQIAATVRAAMGIRSPSRVFMAIGEDIMAGWRIGLEDGAPGVVKVMNNTVSRLTGIAGNGTPLRASDVRLNPIPEDRVDERLGAAIVDAISGWTVEMDRWGTTKMVNRTNKEAARR